MSYTMYPKEAYYINMHLTKVLHQLNRIRADYPQEALVLAHLYADVWTARERIDELLQS